jgi:CubicO group peptidase (beta-lactamase class C family)
MMRKIVYLLLLCLSLIILPIPSLSAKGDSNNMDTKVQHIESYIHEEMKAARIPGLSLAIVKGDQIVHLGGYGHRNDEGSKVTPQTPFILGSTTKSITAMAVMKLVEEGKINLDTPVGNYLSVDKAIAHITIRNLLNQTSGISGAPMKDHQDWIINEENTGRIFQYSNENYRLLGQVITEVTNQSYGEYLQTTIFSALDMKHSFTSQKQAEENGLAEGFRTWFGFNMANKLPYNEEYLAAGYVISSAEDMAHYLIAQMNKGYYQNQAIVSSTSIEEMHKPTVKAPIMGPESFYGMGWFNSPTNGIPTIKHSGEVPNYHSTMIIMPNEDYGIILLANINNSILTSGLIEKMGAGIVDILAGNKPEHIAGSAHFQTYVLMDGIILIILIALFFHIRNIKKWIEKVRQGKIIGRLLLTLFIDFLIPIVLLTQFPKLLGFTWSFLFDFVPDVTSILFSISVILLMVGLIKIYLFGLHLVKKRRYEVTL